MSKQLWIDKQYMNTYHPSTPTPVNPVHTQAAQAGAVGFVSGAMVGAATCPPAPTYPVCVGTRAAATGLAGAQAVYMNNFFK